jgi:phospholipase/carboxylesterase
VIGCSGYPHPGWRPQLPLPPVLLTHGREDPVVPCAASAELHRLWLEAGGASELLTFAGGHGIDPALFPALRTFLQRRWATAERAEEPQAAVDRLTPPLDLNTNGG